MYAFVHYCQEIGNVRAFFSTKFSSHSQNRNAIVRHLIVYCSWIEESNQ